MTGHLMIHKAFSKICFYQNSQFCKDSSITSSFHHNLINGLAQFNAMIWWFGRSIVNPGLVVRTFYCQSRDPMFKTTRSLHYRLILSFIFISDDRAQNKRRPPCTARLSLEVAWLTNQGTTVQFARPNF